MAKVLGPAEEVKVRLINDILKIKGGRNFISLSFTSGRKTHIF